VNGLRQQWVRKQDGMEHIIKEATESELHPNNMNRDEGFSLRKSWKPLLQTIKESAFSKAR
jgi:hypothetical protein